MGPDCLGDVENGEDGAGTGDDGAGTGDDGAGTGDDGAGTGDVENGEGSAGNGDVDEEDDASIDDECDDEAATQGDNVLHNATNVFNFHSKVNVRGDINGFVGFDLNTSSGLDCS